MNIALFGGSFDPFHIGHEAIVSKIIDNLLIDKLFIIPTYINPFKEKYHLEPKIRYELLCELYEKDENIEILEYEIEQKRKVPTIFLSFQTSNINFFTTFKFNCLIRHFLLTFYLLCKVLW